MTEIFLLASLLAIARFSHADVYNPTRLLRSANSSYAYLFDATPSSDGQANFHAININTTFNAGEIIGSSVSAALPYLQDGTPQAYTPIMDANGRITVVIGDCSTGAAGTRLWRFSPDAKSNSGNGFWEEVNMPARTTSSGATYLAGGIAFSPRLSATTKDVGFYVFGGMCPWSNSTSSNWIASADYYDTMLDIAPVSEESPFYRMSTVDSLGQPIAEAGFSITGLTPSLTQSGGASGRKQEQEFLLLGGHTRGAFLNMSQVALFALPQQSWAFFPVAQPSNRKVDLSINQASIVIEPRSGHTAILSEDGSCVILFGGWVGDISNPAQPQLAVLHLGPGYGGDANDAWSWKIPDQSGTGLDPGAGLYGHGATMLPGGVMMIAGGYSIVAPAARRKRDGPALNSNVLLYNVTSNEWLTSYNSPQSAALGKGKSNAGNSGQQTILGVGIGVGVLIVVVLIIIGYWYAWRRQHLDDDDDDDDDDDQSTYVSSDKDNLVKQTQQPFLEKTSPDNQFKGPITSETALFQHRDRNPGDSDGPPAIGNLESAGSTGRFVEIPSPTRGLRKNLASRPYMYHAAPRHDDHRITNYHLGAIHPIVEREDEDDQSSIHRSLRDITHHSSTTNAFLESEKKMDEIERSLVERPEQRRSMTMMPTPILDKREPTLPVIRPLSDPFVDPHPNPLGSNPISPAPAAVMIRPLSFEIKNHFSSKSKIPLPLGRQPLAKDSVISENWVTYSGEDESGAAMLPPEPAASGRSSPTKTDERTSSTLSSRSRVSHTSSASGALPTRTGTVLSGMYALTQGDSHNKKGSVSAEILRSDRTDTMSSSSGGYPSLPASRLSSVRTDGSGRPYVRHAELRQQEIQPSIYPDNRPPRVDESTESFVTTRSSFAQLQNEGEHLLGRNPSPVSNIPMPTAAVAPLTAVAALTRQRDLSPTRRLFGAGPHSPIAPLATNVVLEPGDKSYSKDNSNNQSPLGTNHPPVSAGSESNSGQDTNIARLSSSASRHQKSYEIAPPSSTPSSSSAGGGWVGSLRRALTAISVSERSFTARSITPPPPSSTAAENASRVNQPQHSHSTKSTHSENGPRRTVSAGSTSSATAATRLLKEKRGQRDWPVLAGQPSSGTSTSYLGSTSVGVNTPADRQPFIQESYFHADPDEWGVPRTSMDRIQAEGEWDVEGAAACRDVQMLGATFTVPKSRLRVVNADISGGAIGGAASPDPGHAARLARKDSQRSVSDGAVARQESLRRRQAGMGPSRGATMAKQQPVEHYDGKDWGDRSSVDSGLGASERTGMMGRQGAGRISPFDDAGVAGGGGGGGGGRAGSSAAKGMMGLFGKKMI